MTCSRFFDATDKIFLNEDGSEKQGQEIIFLDNKVGDDNVTAIISFTEGKLNDKGTIPSGSPGSILLRAVFFSLLGFPFLNKTSFNLYFRYSKH